MSALKMQWFQLNYRISLLDCSEKHIMQHRILLNGNRQRIFRFHRTDHFIRNLFADYKTKVCLYFKLNCGVVYRPFVHLCVYLFCIYIQHNIYVCSQHIMYVYKYFLSTTVSPIHFYPS